MEIPVELLQSHCPVEVVAETRELRTMGPDFQQRLQAFIQAAVNAGDKASIPAECYALAVGYVLQEMSWPKPGGEILLLSAIRNVAPVERPKISDQVTTFLLHRNADNLPAAARFNALYEYGIDARGQLSPKYSERQLTDPRSEAFAYALYASQFGDLEEIAKIKAALKTVEPDVHELNGFLTAILEARPLPLLDAVLGYIHDERRGIGVDGPGTGPSPTELLAPWQDKTLWQ